MIQGCWKNLPSEIRLQILMETDLVRRTTPMKAWMDDDKIEIEHGKLVPSTCACYSVPTAIFQVSKLFNCEATEIFFSKNIFMFRGDLLATTQFLAGLPNPAVQNLRIIELHLDFDQIYFGLSTPGSRISREWHDLISLLRERLLLSKLWLSILAIDPDTQFKFVTLNNDGDHDYQWLHTASFQLLKPLDQLKGLRKFHVSLCWSTDFEAVVEKAVMGPEYDSLAEGKPSYKFFLGLNSVLRMPMAESLAISTS
ncbi:MAG: hypothetical protein HETSPECPRED_006450 [Heterodermia speciosa]|uniref:F-box domain-containing protein n=1 Tax=Heterodermia speciosa TaxID=116794 RepID=A0A8H3IPR6_9LECA|nr:MAG: hypothetical protein HETSPECPRED_006450 [Heterodermia speciosa]